MLSFITGLVGGYPRVRIALVAAPRVVGNASLVEPRKKEEDAKHQKAISLWGVTLHVLCIDELRNNQEQAAEGK